MLSIERAKTEEVDAIKEVLTETWLATYADHLSRATIDQVTTHWHDPRVLRSQMEKPGHYFGVAKDDGAIVGLVTVVAVSQAELFLSRLYVRPAYQGRGIGTSLLEAAIASYPEAAIVRLAVEERNERGHAYWRARGFVDASRKTEEVGDDSIAVITMEKKLR